MGTKENLCEQTKSCEWHKDDEPLDEFPIHCPNCGRMLETKVCEACGDEFLDWEWKHADDVLASPCASSSGDLCCSGCIASVERELEQYEQYEEDEDWGRDPYDDFEP